jgi:CRISPR-associated endonuclease/helicase Cas3
MPDQEAVLRLWAKTSQAPEGGRFHPLLFHIMDVAAVAGLVWDQHLGQALKERLGSALGTDARGQVVLLAGAHDIGKASPGFQRRSPALRSSIGLPFRNNDQDRPHGHVSAFVLNEAAGSCQVSLLLGQIAGGHHGVFPRSEGLRMGRGTLGNADWERARQTVLNELAAVVGLDVMQMCRSKSEIIDPFIVPLLAGFVSVVDWIASNQDFFPCVAEREKTVEMNSRDYWAKAQEQADVALRKLGWLPRVKFAQEAGFEDVFPRLRPNALQGEVRELASKQHCPYLMIIEAPMGHGKTEAALYAADLAMCRGFARGMYIAMPTQATSNAMFKRILDDYLSRRGHEGKLNLQLVHGDALLTRTGEVEVGEMPEFVPSDIDSNEQRSDTEAQSWFTAKKRPLLAPFGVGTIDQSLLSVLQTRHWFVRLFGLAGKVVIFDEVHAYDAYMSTILERLLCWLAELDCTVILLSATLPEAKRKALVTAFSGQNGMERKRYPRLTLAQPHHYLGSHPADQVPVCENVAVGEVRDIDLHFAKTDLDALTGMLARRLEEGGCAAVICNTVDRSIEVYKSLRDSLKDTECSLFHARTVNMWRRQREEDVLCKFGKGDRQIDGTHENRHRPKRAVLVATQVIEQSLDLDFDLMVSEIAPVDLLLQRMGRLQRHPRQRPKGLRSAFTVLCDAAREGPPPDSFGNSIEHVYDRYILLRTWLALRERHVVQVPAGIEAMVEAVYGESGLSAPADWAGALEAARKQMESWQDESEKAARRLLVSQPVDAADVVEHFNSQLIDEEDPEVHKAVRAATREGDPSITLVAVEANTALTAEPTVSDVRDLLDHSARLSHQGIYHALVADGVAPEQWANNSHLRHARLLRLDGQNQVRVGGFQLTIDEELGIVIEKDGEDNGRIQSDR